jgi:hypothetical protein
MENDTKQFPFFLYLLIIVLFLAAGSFIVLLLNPGLLAKTQDYIAQVMQNTVGKSSTESLQLSPSPTSTISSNKIIPIKQGEEIYNISQGKTNGPKITKAVINPHDPENGTTQTVSISTSHTKPITSVIVSVFSDNMITPHNLTLSSGTNQDGIWSGSWTTDDTHLHKWGFLIESGDGFNKSKAGIAIR